MTKANNDIPVIGITMGDINGIGPEVIIKALRDKRMLNYMTPVIYGSTNTLSYYRKSFHIDDFHYSQVKNEGDFIAQKINVVNCWEALDINTGSPTKTAGEASFKALEKAVKDIKKGSVHALVTGPINKHTIQSEAFNFVGHTEYLTSRFDTKESLMLMVSGDMRIAMASGHEPLKTVSNSISKSKIKEKLAILISTLKNDFGISKPKIAVMGLNPHAGEEGLLGDEEQKVIKPVIDELKDEGNLIYGPFPADGFFGKGEYKKYDAVLTMYHDQGLIPFKTLAFDTGVNYTAGLPIIRTSPDHGTAYSIAGKGEANENSMRQALYLAIDIYKSRNPSI
jgi:4-hydroxythreonine-4-phosphate dehydrogenase